MEICYDVKNIQYDAKVIGGRILNERNRMGKTQDELCEALNIGRTNLSRYENGLKVPELNIMLNMCNYFQCELGYLLGEFDRKTRVATDICAETGLSEEAVHILSHIQRKENLRFKRNEPNFNPAEFISHFIENSEEIFRYIHTLWRYSALLNGQKDEFWGLVVDAYNNAITCAYSEEGFIELLKDKIKNSQLFADFKKVYPAITVESIAESHRTSFRLLDKDENLQEFCISNEFLKIVKSFGTIQDGKGGLPQWQ